MSRSPSGSNFNLLGALGTHSRVYDANMVIDWCSEWNGSGIINSGGRILRIRIAAAEFHERIRMQNNSFREANTSQCDCLVFMRSMHNDGNCITCPSDVPASADTNEITRILFSDYIVEFPPSNTYEYSNRSEIYDVHLIRDMWMCGLRPTTARMLCNRHFDNHKTYTFNS